MSFSPSPSPRGTLPSPLGPEQQQIESVCDLEHGSEEVAAILLGGKFDVEDCGFFSKCSHQVEKFDYSAQPPLSVTIYTCATDWLKLVGVILGVIVGIYLLYRLARRTIANRLSFGG